MSAHKPGNGERTKSRARFESLAGIIEHKMERMERAQRNAYRSFYRIHRHRGHRQHLNEGTRNMETGTSPAHFARGSLWSRLNTTSMSRNFRSQTAKLGFILCTTTAEENVDVVRVQQLQRISKHAFKLHRQPMPRTKRSSGRAKGRTCRAEEK